MCDPQTLSLLIGMLSPITGLILLCLQGYTYLKTRHNSVLVLTVSSVVGIGCWGLSYLQWTNHVPDTMKNVLVLTTFALLIIQCVLCIWGSAALFRAFRHFVASPGSGDSAPAAVLQKRPHPDQLSAAPLEPIGLASNSNESSLPVGLADIWRLWFLRRPSSGVTGASDRTIAITASIAILGWIALDRLGSGIDSVFMAWSLPVIGFYIFMALTVAYVTARVSIPRLPFRTTLSVATLAMPLLVVLSWAIEFKVPDSSKTAANILLYVYIFVYGAVALRNFLGSWPIGATALLGFMLIGYYFAEQHAYWSASVWLPAPASAEDYPGSRATAETLLFDQRSKIEQDVKAMQAPIGEEPKIYFVGFAGVGDQRVFAEEIKLAARTVWRRFDVGDRQLLLINDRRDIVRYPIATSTSLTYALKELGEKMNRERDILFLALSSHGSASPLLSVTNGLVSLEQLTGKELREALDKSGIKRKIIVISACHAGAFIPVLRDSNSIIITAAAAEKTSFGCSDDRDLTYFGEAFYRDALPIAGDLRSAFEDAKRAIGLREQHENQTASDPQAYFGSELVSILKKYPMTPASERVEIAAPLADIHALR
jgi:hypothetical protein